MSNFYQLVIADEDRWHLDVDGDEAPIDIWDCRPCEAPPPMRFKVVVDGKRVDFGHTGWASIPIISRRMAECLQSIAPDDIERIPAIVQGELNGNWEVLNVLARPDCICHERSKITYYPKNHSEKPGKPRGIMRLIINPVHVEGHDVFRPKDWEVALIVSERVKNLLESERISGLEFWLVTEPTS